MNSPQSFEIERAQAEYQHAVSELSRYDSDSQKLFSFVSVTLTAAFALGMTADQADIVFLIIPLLTLAIIQYLVSNYYAYRVREKYVHKLEKILGSYGTHTPKLYHQQIKHFYLDLKWWEIPLHPFTGAMFLTILLLLAMSAFCVFRSASTLNELNENYINYYVIICSTILAYTGITFVWSIRKLKQN